MNSCNSTRQHCLLHDARTGTIPGKHMCLMLSRLHQQQSQCTALLHLDNHKHCGRLRTCIYLLHESARNIAHLCHELNPLHPCCAGNTPCMESTVCSTLSSLLIGTMQVCM